jgi:hypothetical protein
MKKILALVIFCLTTSVFAGVVEKILGHTVDEEGITYQVMSGGCTKKGDFKVMQLETMPVQLKLVREKMDYCEAFFPYGTMVKFTWNELGLSTGTEITVANPEAIIRVMKNE